MFWSVEHRLFLPESGKVRWLNLRRNRIQARAVGIDSSRSGNLQREVLSSASRHVENRRLHAPEHWPKTL
jgi:hypothetical protein